MATLLRDSRTQKYDIVAIQEPWKNPFSATTHHPAKDLFHLCYPTNEEEELAKVCFFINKQIDHSKWHFKPVNQNLCTLILETTQTMPVKSPYILCTIPSNAKNTDKA